jgi:hypothetical protein
MSERYPQERHEDETFGVEEITDVFDMWSRPRANRDIRFIMISRAVKNALQSHPEFREIVSNMTRSRTAGLNWGEISLDDGLLDENIALAPNQDFSHASDATGFWQKLPYPEYGANLIHRGLWHAWRQSGDPAVGWPDLFDTEDHCRQAIDHVMSQPQLREEFAFNIAWRPIQTSYPNRMLGPILGLRAYEDRFDHAVNLLSVGPGGGFGEKKMLLGMDFPAPEVYDWYGITHLLERRTKLSQKLKNVMAEKPLVENVFGVDIFPGDLMDDALDWITSSFTPAEQMDKKFMDQIEFLKNSKPDNYHPIREDFTKDAVIESIQPVIGQKIDVVLFSTVLYQQSPQGRQHMIENALKVLDDNGLIFVLDFAVHRPQIKKVDNPVDNLHFPNDWSQWTYRLHILDPAKYAAIGKAPEFETAMLFDSGRCSAVRFPQAFHDFFTGIN